MNDEVDAFGVVVVYGWGRGCCWPSRREGLRACGWREERLSECVRASGEGVRVKEEEEEEEGLRLYESYGLTETEGRSAPMRWILVGRFLFRIVVVVEAEGAGEGPGEVGGRAMGAEVIE